MVFEAKTFMTFPDVQTKTKYFPSTIESPIRDDLLALINASMIDTPRSEKSTRNNDLRYLMTLDLIKTPKDEKVKEGKLFFPIESLNGFSFDNSDDQMKISKLSDHDRMICHEDFPRLLAFANSKHTGDTEKNVSSNKRLIAQSIDETKKMKGKLPIKNLTIFRGQCASLDRKIDEHVLLFKQQFETPKINNVSSSKTHDNNGLSLISPIKSLHSNKLKDDWYDKVMSRQSLKRKRRVQPPLKLPLNRKKQFAADLSSEDIGKFQSIVKPQKVFDDDPFACTAFSTPSFSDSKSDSNSNSPTTTVTANTPCLLKTPQATNRGNEALPLSTIFVNTSTEAPLSEISSRLNEDQQRDPSKDDDTTKSGEKHLNVSFVQQWMY